MSVPQIGRTLSREASSAGNAAGRGAGHPGGDMVELDLAPRAPTTRLGVEHELCLWRGEEQVDFRGLVGELTGGIAPLDPGDPRARRLPSGVSLTADGHEAELATPPLPVGPGVPHRIDDLLRTERSELRRVASTHCVTSITGFSTHLNISVSDDRVVEVARRLVDSCLTALVAVVEARRVGRRMPFSKASREATASSRRPRCASPAAL